MSNSVWLWGRIQTFCSQPATIPQGVIDMNRVLEVSSAEDVTGNQFSLAITSPDRVTFVKGTTREESRWWQDVLSVFPRMHKHGRHKRNATFPGIKGSSGAASASAAHQSTRPGASSRAPNTMESPVNQRVRFHSISSDLRGTRRPCSAPSLDTQQFAHQKQFSGGNRSSQHYDSVTESSNGSDISNEDDDGLSQTRRGEDSGAFSDETEKNNQKNSYYSSKNRQISSTPTLFNDASRTENAGSYTSASGSTVTPFNSLLYSRSNPIPTPSQTSSSRAGLPSSTSSSAGLLASTPSKLLRDDHKENTPPYVPDYDDNPPTSESPPTQDKQTHRLRTRRALNREARALSQPRSSDHSPTHGMKSVALVRNSFIVPEKRTIYFSTTFAPKNRVSSPTVSFDLDSSSDNNEPSFNSRFSNVCGREQPKNRGGISQELPFLSTSYTPVYQPKSIMPLKSILKKSLSEECFGVSRVTRKRVLPPKSISVNEDPSRLLVEEPTRDSKPSHSASKNYSSVPDILKDSLSYHESSYPKLRRRETLVCETKVPLRRVLPTPPKDVGKAKVSQGRNTFTSAPPLHGSGVLGTNASVEALVRSKHRTRRSGELDTSSVLADLEATKREEKLKDIAASITTTSSRRRHYHHHQQRNISLTLYFIQPPPGSDHSPTHGMKSVALVRNSFIVPEKRTIYFSTTFAPKNRVSSPTVSFDLDSSSDNNEPSFNSRFSNVCGREQPKNRGGISQELPVLSMSYTPVYQPKSIMPLKSILKKSLSEECFGVSRVTRKRVLPPKSISVNEDPSRLLVEEPTRDSKSSYSASKNYSSVPDILKDSLSYHESSYPKLRRRETLVCETKVPLRRVLPTPPNDVGKAKVSQGRNTFTSAPPLHGSGVLGTNASVEALVRSKHRTRRSGELDTSSVLADLEATKREEKLKDIAASITTTSSRRRHYHHHQQSNVADKPTRDRDTEDMDSISDPTDTPPPTQARGAPDGCGGVEDGSSVSLPRVDLPAEDLLFIKKGWLFKATDNQEWNKHWFVLQGTGLRFYRNSSAEETGILDGIIDLGTAEDIHNLDVARNYGFVIKTWSEKQFVFSAVTAGIRSNWVTALRNAAGLKDCKTDISPGKEVNNSKDSLPKTATIESVAAERDSPSQSKSLLANNKKNASLLSKSSSSNLESFSTPNGLSKTTFSANDTGSCKPHGGVKSEDVSENRSSSRVALSSDDEYKTASETSAASNLSNDNADFFDWDGSRLPNAVNSPIKKPRSQSSPPNSRRGTSDSFPSSESSFGMSRNLLDRYKNMQNLTTKHSTPVSSKTGADELDSKPMSDTRSISQANHDTCDAKSTCAKLSSYSPAAKNEGAFKLSDSLRSLDLEGSIHHDKVSSSGTLASGSGDALLVDLLETQVETLKAKLEATQADLLELHKEHVALHQRVTLSPDTKGHHSYLSQKQNASPISQENLPSTNQDLENVKLNTATAEKTLSDTLEQLSTMQNLNSTYREKLEVYSRENLMLKKNLEEANEEAARYRKQVDEHCSTILQLQTCVEESDILLGQYKLKIEEKEDEFEALHANLKETEEEFLRRQVEMEQFESELISENKLLKEQLDVSHRMLLEIEQRNVKLGEAKMQAEEESSYSRHELQEALARADFLHEEVEQLVRQVNVKEQQLAGQTAALRDLHAKHEQEKATWREDGEGGEAQRCTVSQLQSSLEESERRVTALRARLDDSDITDGLQDNKGVTVLQVENASLIAQLRECHDEIAQLKESVKCEKSEAYKWKDLVKELRSLLDGRNIDMDRKREEIRLARESLKSAQQEHDMTRDKLQRGIEENESLTTKLRELQRQLNSQSKRTSSVPSVYASRDKLPSRRNLPRFDSLSDLSNVDFSLDPDTLDRETLNDEYCNVRSRLELSLNEIRALRRELRDSQSEHDAMQLKHLQLTQDCAKQRQDSDAQLAFMTERVQDLTNKLSYSEKQVRQMKTKMTRAESRDRRRTQSLRGKDALSVGKDVELKLSQLEARIDQLMPTVDMTADGTQSSIPPSQQLLPTVQQVVLLLQQKLASLNDKRNNLKNSNQWTKEAQLKNFAERIAYETVLLGQVTQALRICNQSNCNNESIKLQDLMESHRKMAFLEKKLTNPEFDLDTMAPLEFYTSMLAEKLVVTGEVLASVNSQESHEKPNPTLSGTCRDLQARLLERECQLARLISNYKEEKLHEIAVVMAQGNRNNATELDESVLLEEVRIREAWNTAHNLLVQEIMNYQTSQSLFRMTHMLNLTDDTAPSVPSASSLSLTLCSAEATDRLQAAAEESLKQEMEESVLTLSQKYEEILAQQRAGDTSLINSVSASIEDVLSEFAGVMAQKALIDGHLALLQEEFDKRSLPIAQNSLIISEDNKDPMESAVDVLDSEAHLLMFLGGKDSSVESLVNPALSHAEFAFLYNKGVYQSNEDSKQLLQQILSKKTEVLAPASSSSFRSSSLSLHQTSPVASDRDQDGIEQPRLRAAISMSKINPSPKSHRKHENRKSRRSSDITGMTSPGCKMCEDLRHEISRLKKKQQLQNSEDSKCANCPKLLDTIERLETAQRARVEQSSPSDSNQTLAEMENRIMVLEAAYEAKITALELQYKQALASHPDCGDDTIRQKYQKEIKELRGLCEKGLGTMEISTQRIVAEIKEKHRQELSLLQAEKEQALAEETQATLAALDAMRKAHEAEVQREVAKMKEEFILKMQSGQDLGEISQRHEAEMRDIRREILSLSEKYSVKCLESADLESKIDNLTKQLNDSSQIIADLEARNNKLKSQLSEKISSLKAGATAGDAESNLKLCIAETILKDDKLAKMGAELQRIQAHEGEVMEVCRHLRHFLRSDRPTMASDQLASVTDRLEQLMLTAPKSLRDHTEGSQQQRQARPALRRPKVYSSKELTRSPSCPRLGAHPPRLSCPSAATDDFLHCFPLPNSPLSGMVASRKKVFENCDGCSNSSKARVGTVDH
ncbi:Pleckstrin domain [Trinorchestia longiramus]|nr:Pleckstrin domain [Trinorchestia longiramus]